MTRFHTNSDSSSNKILEFQDGVNGLGEVCEQSTRFEVEFVKSQVTNKAKSGHMDSRILVRDLRNFIVPAFVKNLIELAAEEASSVQETRFAQPFQVRVTRFHTNSTRSWTECVRKSGHSEFK